MKKHQVIAILVLSAFTILSSCGSKSGSKEKSDTSVEAVEVSYTCPMHPEVDEKHPGNCPKCGMELVQKEEDNGPVI